MSLSTPRQAERRATSTLAFPFGESGEQPRAERGLLNSPSFRGFPLGGGSLRSKVVRGVVIRILASRATSECEPIAVCLNSPSFRGFPLGGGSLRSKVVRGVVIHIPASRVANECEPIAVCFNSPSFRGFPLGGGSLRSKAVRGVVIRIPASRAESECEPIAVFKTYIPPPHVCKKYTFSNRLKCRNNTYNKLRRFFLCGNGFGTTRQQSLSP